MSTHVHPISRKRKERETQSAAAVAAVAAAAAVKLEPIAGSSRPASNRLLAGYLAHEFLTKGTLLGKQWPPERSEPGSAQTGRVGEKPAPSTLSSTAYDEVAYLFKTDGVHIPGIVNPTQLARWLQM